MEDEVDTAVLPFPRYGGEKTDEAAAAKSDLFVMTMQIINDECNAVFVYEAAGTMSEYWNAPDMPFDNFLEQLQQKFLQLGLGRAVGLRFLGTAIPTKNNREYLLTFLTLCELSLYGPVLPHHRDLRTGIDLGQLMPFQRWLKLCAAAHHVPAMQSLEDYSRYTNEICQLLNWSTPAQINAFTAEKHRSIPRDMFEEMFVDAARYRFHVPWIFLDYTSYLNGSGEAHKRFLSIFNFPVIQYTNKTRYTSNKAIQFFATRWQLVRLAMRAILLKDELLIPMPYKPKDQDEVDFLQQQLVKDLEEVIGLRIENIQLRWMGA